MVAVFEVLTVYPRRNVTKIYMINSTHTKKKNKPLERTKVLKAQ